MGSIRFGISARYYVHWKDAIRPSSLTAKDV